MIEVCRIDVELYKIVTPDIQTDIVIITDERIEHIRDHHPNDYEKYGKYFSQILTDPDFIIEGKWKNTAMVLKEIIEENEKLRLILKIKTSSDPAEFQNSITSFHKINDKEWRRLSRNKKILYKRDN